MIVKIIDGNNDNEMLKKIVNKIGKIILKLKKK